MAPQALTQPLQNKTPEQCVDMMDVRAEIDRVDRSLIKLLAERQGYIERAAEIKGRRDQIRDEDRIADVLAKITAEAGRAGLKAEIARAVWRELMERCIAHEMDCFEARTR